jgi:hypothetical protein
MDKIHDIGVICSEEMLIHINKALDMSNHSMFLWLNPNHWTLSASDDDTIEVIKNISLFIIDVTKPTERVLLEIGCLIGQGKAFILFSNGSESIPNSLSDCFILIYDSSDMDKFVSKLSSMIQDATENTLNYHYQMLRKKKNSLKKVFISYSHKDKEYLDRVMVHLKPLERENLIDLWVDERIKAGDKWKDEINKALEQSNVAVLLISADYLASDFIANQELQPLLINASMNGTKILCLLLKPSRFIRDKSLNGYQASNNPEQPIDSLSEYQQEDYYEALATEIENTLL